MFRISSLLLSILLLLCFSVKAQRIYNRFQFHQYKWRAYHTSSFHIYFPIGYDSLCSHISKQVDLTAIKIGKRMGSFPESVPNIIIYPSIDQQYESNIGSSTVSQLTFPTFISKGNRLVIAYNGNYDDLTDQLQLSMARSCWEIQLENPLQQQLNNPVSQKVPYWFKEGAIKYFAHQWPSQNEDELLRILKTSNPSCWEELTASHPTLAGQAFCYFLSQNYLSQTPLQVFYLLRKRKPLAVALRLVTKTDYLPLYQKCLAYYSERLPKTVDTPLDNFNTTFHRMGGQLRDVQFNSAMSHALYTVFKDQRRKVYLYDFATRKTKLLVSYLLPPWLTEYGRDPYPLVQWKFQKLPQIIVPRKGKLFNYEYDLDGNKRTDFVFPRIDGVVTANDDLLTGFTSGQSDIISYDPGKERYTTYTNDRSDDGQTATLNNHLGDGPIYLLSKRQLAKDTGRFFNGIFRLTNRKIEPLLVDPLSYLQSKCLAQTPDNGILFSKNTYGTARFTYLKIDKGTGPVTLSSFMPFQLFQKDRQLVFYSATKDSISVQVQPYENWRAGQSIDTSLSPWLKDFFSHQIQQAEQDSILKAAKDTIPSFLSGVFNPTSTQDSLGKMPSGQNNDAIYNSKKSAPYILQLYSAYFSAKVNNDYLINRYQPYQSYQGMFKFPNIGGMVMGGFSDLFENHHVNLAFRLPAGSDGSDFYVKYRNTTGLLDWGISYYRKSEALQPDPLRNWMDENGRPYPSNAKVKTGYYELSFNYPFSYFAGLELSLAARQDKTIFLATEKYSLDFPAYKSLWAIGNLGYSLDWTQPTLPLLKRGLAISASVDAFKGFTQGQPAILGLGIQSTYHRPLYRFITLTANLQAGYSAGEKLVLYNLGGVENNLTVRTDSNAHFSQTAPYAFQTLVTPFRGHTQNSLYGRSYTLLNLDLYFPIFQSLLPLETPLPSINNMLVGLFADFANTGGKSAYSVHGWKNATGFSVRTSLGGYPLRLDMGWPGFFWGKPIWYLSMSTK